MEKTNISKSLIIAIALALLAATIGFVLFGGTDSARFAPITTAAAAGAHVTPTEPKQRVEPK